MTVSSSTSRVAYTGNGVTTAFAVPFFFLENADLVVYVNGVLQALTTNYTLSGAGSEAGGTCTFVTAPASAAEVVIYRDPTIVQTTDFPPNDRLPSASLERALDRLTMISQRLKDQVSRSLRLSDDYAGGASTLLPDPAAGQFLGWNASANAIENYLAAGGTAYSQSTVGQLLWPRTAAEISAGVTPTANFYPPGDVRRYGAVGDNSTNDATAIQAAFNSGHDVEFEAEKSYRVSSGLTWTRNYAVIRANGAAITCTADITPLTIGTTSGDPQLYPQILGNLRIIKESGTPTLPGILMRGVYNGRLEVSAKGFYDNIEIRPSGSMGFAYNSVYMQDMVGQTRSALYLNPNTSAFVNENDFYHGRFDSPNAACTALIYAPDSGGSAGNPNNNRFHEPNLELSGTGSVQALYFDGGHHNALIHPRVEVDGTATVSVARIYITSDALLAFVDDRYIGGTQYIRNDGTNTRFLCSTQRFAHYRDAVGVADIGERVFRTSANSGGLPVSETYDAYIGSGDSQGHKTGLARNTASGYFELYQLSGSLVTRNGRLYECILAHTSGSTTEPGVGASWQTNWRLLPTGTDTAGAAAWVTATSYTGPTEQGRIAADGSARFKTLRVDTAAPTVSAGQVAFGATTATTVGAAGGASALPANPTGYLIVNVAGTAYKIPYYNA